MKIIEHVIVVIIFINVLLGSLTLLLTIFTFPLFKIEITGTLIIVTFCFIGFAWILLNYLDSIEENTI